MSRLHTMTLLAGLVLALVTPACSQSPEILMPKSPTEIVWWGFPLVVTEDATGERLTAWTGAEFGLRGNHDLVWRPRESAVPLPPDGCLGRAVAQQPYHGESLTNYPGTPPLQDVISPYFTLCLVANQQVRWQSAAGKTLAAVFELGTMLVGKPYVGTPPAWLMPGTQPPIQRVPLFWVVLQLHPDGSVTWRPITPAP